MDSFSNKKYDAIIIGSGAGGLTAAVALSRAGQNVLVLEQHYVPGGWSHSFQLQGQKFSPGVHYIGGLGKGEYLRRTYEGLGLAKDLKFFKMIHKGFEHCLIGDVKFDYSADSTLFEKDLIEQFPNEKKGIQLYLRLLWKVENQVITLSRIEKPIQKIFHLFKSFALIRHGWKTLDKVISKYIKDPDLKAILCIQCGDVGLTPTRANFAYFSAVMGHYSTGGYFPMGGGAAIVKAMTNELKRNKGEIKCKSRVEKIIVENGKARGVRLTTGEEFWSSTVLSNADPHITYKKLIGESYLSAKLLKKLDKTSYSPSSLMLFVTVDLDVRELGIDSGNYWVSADNKIEEAMQFKSIDEIVDGEKFDSCFIGCSTLKDPSSFNGSYFNFEVVTFVDSSFFEEFSAGNDEYQELKNRIALKMLNNLSDVVPGVKEHVVQFELGTPSTNKFFINSTRGNVYGIDKTFAQLGPGSFSTKGELENLFLCGASTTSHGIAGATNSGLLAAATILGTSVEHLINNSDDDLTVYQCEDPLSWSDEIKNKIKIRAARFESSHG